MKKVILLFAMSFFVMFVKAQKADVKFSKDYYLKKSKSQKTIAWIMVGGGIAMITTGLVIADNKVENDPLGAFQDIGNNKTGSIILSVIGAGVSLGSIPLFISASKNKRLAATVSFSTIKYHIMQQSTFAHVFQPALSIKINL